MRWSKWYLINGKVIRRYQIDNPKKWQRYPKKDYSSLRPEDLPAFVERLNGPREAARLRAEEAYKIKHTFITQQVLERFHSVVSSQSSNSERANAIYNRATEGLGFFINDLKLNDPVDWKGRQEEWGAALIKQGIARSTIKFKIECLNRLLSWLHENNPRLFPLIKLNPISGAVLRHHEATRKLNSATKVGQFVPESTWQKIEQQCRPDVLCFLKLMYYLGLRRAEALGLCLEDVRTKNVAIQRQLVSVPAGRPNYGPPKSRRNRKVPYWFTTPEETYKTVEHCLREIKHPDTLSDQFTIEMDRLKIKIEMHDLRRTFITRALREGRTAVEVKEAVGHSSISTTMRYLVDIEDTDDAPFIPKRSA
jgi:integrase